MEKPGKKNYSPPGWIVSWFDRVRLDPERAKKFHDMRKRLCDRADPEDHSQYPLLHIDALWSRALGLLLEQERMLTEEIDLIKKDT